MPRRRETRQLLFSKIDSTEASMVRAFLQAMQEVTADINIGEIERVIASGGGEREVVARLPDVAAIMEPVAEEIRATVREGGKFEAGLLPQLPDGQGGEVRIRFNVRNSRAERIIREQSSELIRQITDAQRDAVRVALEDAARRGINPRQSALDLVGRVNRMTGNREGGIISLTERQARAVTRAQRDLLSGDPARMRSYLKRAARDKRFDGTVMRAVDNGRPVPRADAQRIARRYSAKLLKVRGDAVARTETLSSFNAGQHEAMQQAVDGSEVQEENITRVWDSAGDTRVRDSHRTMDGQRRGQNEAFETPLGFRLMYPGDSSLGAPAREVIQCRCIVRHEIDFAAEAAA